MVDPTHLVDLQQIGRMLGGLPRQRVMQLAKAPGFPKPAATHVAGQLWDIDDIRAWAHNDGRYLHDVGDTPRD